MIFDNNYDNIQRNTTKREIKAEKIQKTTKTNQQTECSKTIGKKLCKITKLCY